MRIHCLQHASYEGLGTIAEWIKAAGHHLSTTKVWQGETLPNDDQFDALIVMGGPMSVYEENIYPWLVAEKAFIARVIAQEKRVLGVCLGAQLVADVLGAKVYPNQYTEVGWYAVRRAPNGDNPVLAALPAEFTAFHWHGDMFEIPESAVALGASDACRNQGFVFGDNVLALQFHLEITPAVVNDFVVAGYADLRQGPFVQTQDRLATNAEPFAQSRRLMVRLLDRFFLST